MPWTVLECKLSATSTGGTTTSAGRTLYDSIEDAISSFESNTNPTSIDSISTRPIGPNRCAVIITYTS